MIKRNYEQFYPLGLRFRKWDYVVALAGNPNTGKSTVFNALTGLRQHTGNWPGKTVTRAQGGFSYRKKNYKLIDLPGTYSLLSASTDEEIARNFILFAKPDCTIVVLDATCLERNLNLGLQVLEITDKVVFVLNLMDEAKRKGIEIDVSQLSDDLGVPVIPMIAKTTEGRPQLLEAVEGIVRRKINTRPFKVHKPKELQQAISTLVSMIKQVYPRLPNAEWIAMRLLEGDNDIRQAVQNGTLEALCA